MKKGIITTTAFILFLAIFSIGTFFLPPREFSENENRMLTAKPEINLETVGSGEAQAELVTFASDQLPFRDFFISLKTTAEKLSGKGDIGGVYILSDGSYVSKTMEKDINDETFKRNLEGVNALFLAGKEQGIKNMSFILSPTASAVFRDKLPAKAEVFDQKARIDEAKKAISFGSFIELYSEFTKSPDSLFYKTDHHWTSRGAYLAYTKYCAAKSQEPKAYTANTVATDFRGTLWSKAPYFGAPCDTIELFNLENEEDIELYIGEEKQKFSIYDRSKLKEKDKYKVFLGDNHPRMTIKNKNGKGHLLLIKDSYANSFLPFIAEDFEKITIIDPRYFNGSTRELVKKEGVTDILVLYNIETFLEEASVYKLTL